MQQDKEMQGAIVRFEIGGGTACGQVQHDNGKSVRVWYKGQVITRHKEKHGVKLAPLLTGVTYYVEPNGGK